MGSKILKDTVGLEHVDPKPPREQLPMGTEQVAGSWVRVRACLPCTCILRCLFPLEMGKPSRPLLKLWSPLVVFFKLLRERETSTYCSLTFAFIGCFLYTH